MEETKGIVDADGRGRKKERKKERKEGRKEGRKKERKRGRKKRRGRKWKNRLTLHNETIGKVNWWSTWGREEENCENRRTV